MCGGGRWSHGGGKEVRKWCVGGGGGVGEFMGPALTKLACVLQGSSDQ